MKLIVAAVGKLKAGPERDLYDRYAGRIAPAGKQAALGPLTSLEIPESRRKSVSERQAEESALILERFGDGDVILALDERGKGMTSENFANMLADYRDSGVTQLVFALGGADGHGDEMRSRAARLVSLGPMTLAHGLARVVLAEQIYRAITILTGHPYHRA
mgnify:CR=1 FL=1